MMERGIRTVHRLAKRKYKCGIALHEQQFLFQPNNNSNCNRTIITTTKAAAASDTIPSTQEDIRNIGILAHVDHGKTTVTERMLHYSGKIRRMGNVDAGNTTMDFLPQERERGITINSAAISFEWDSKLFNLIDTPGHVDFTFETQRSLRVLDGGVVILDGVSGVQSQTMTVWRQANHFSIPRFAFVNKMDRDGASIERVEKSIINRLGVKPLTIQMPLGEEKDFHGMIDLLSLNIYSWDKDDENDDASQSSSLDKDDGACYTTKPLPRDHPLYEAAINAREKLIEDITEFDDELADLYLTRMDDDEIDYRWCHDGDENESTSMISDEELWDALERIVLNEKSGALVVLCGAALR
jgi:elongation factor G